jgi:hypothetical protein
LELSESNVPTVKTLEEKRIASAAFVWNWEEAKALNHALHKLRRQLREAYGIDNLQMRFKNPWGGPTHSEFSLVVELAKGATAATAGAVVKCLLHVGRDFLKKHKATTKDVKTKSTKTRKPRSAKTKKNVSMS